MQFSLKNRLRLISFLPLVILLLVASYFVYNSYGNYKSAQVVQAELATNKELNKLLDNISRERGMTVIYLGNPSSGTLKSLSKQRAMVDTLAKKYLDGKNQDVALALESALKKIKAIRQVVDAKQIDFKSVYTAYTNVQTLAIKELEKIADADFDSEISNYSNVYISFLHAIKYTSIERDSIAYAIAKNTPLKQEEIYQWISYIAQADNFNYSSLNNIELKTELNKVLKNKDFQETLTSINQARASVIVSVATKTKYRTDANLWFALLSEKIHTLSEAQNLLIQAMDKRAVTVKENAIKILAISLSIWVISIIFAILGLLLSNEIARNILNLEHILKKVAQNTKREIKDEEINLQTAKGTKEAYDLLEHIIEQTEEDKQAAQEASEAKSMFLANMSHEIRTPLNGIVGFIELLKSTDLEEEQNEFVEIIEKSSENLLEIINNILDLSKIESNKIEIEDIVFNPIEEFESAVEIYAVRASEKQINLGCFIDPALEQPLKGDPTKIKEVVVNLLSNAIKFTSASGAINVEIRKEESHQDGITRIRVEVQDSGIGVTSEQKAKIFEAFSQADTSITRKYGGTGLGLTISSRFIELMGGQLDLESEPGQGTTFFFTIDLEEVETRASSLQGTYSNINALVLESTHKPKRQDGYLLEYLDFYGVNYTKFKNSAEIEALQNQKEYDLIFIDYEHCHEDELKGYASLPEELVLITKSAYMKLIESFSISIFKTLYEPLNSSKLRVALDNYKKESVKVEKAPQEKKRSLEDIDLNKAKFDANILVVEDNIINQKLIKRTLEELGLTVTLASNGLEGFQKRKDGDFDLIFMDIQMPFLDGMEATKEILEFEEEYQKAHIPVLALTANALKGDRERFLAAGLDEYTTKPLVRSEILLLLYKFLADKVILEEETPAQVEEAPLQIEQEEPEIEEVIINKKETLPEVEEPKEYTADILLIKKSPFETKLFQKVLDSLEYKYEIANSLEELENKVKEGSYKVILLDKEVENLNVDTFATLLKTESQKRDMQSHIILISNDTENDADKAFVDEIISDAVNKDLIRLIIEKFI